MLTSVSNMKVAVKMMMMMMMCVVNEDDDDEEFRILRWLTFVGE